MANLNNARTIFAFTSPRTIEKIIPEIEILVDNFSGQKWNKETQVRFFDLLFASEYYEGKQRPQDPSFAARDRITRAPKALGFVDLKPTIQLTEVGEQLLSGRRTNEVIARQLFKFQLPSPYHRIPEARNFNVRPYLELLRAIKVIGNISKTEIAIFFVQLANYQDFDNVISAIRKYREDYKAHTGNKKLFTDDIFSEEVKKIYAEEIENENFKGRQDNDNTEQALVERKKSNQYDYADALIRYLRATQL
ncbi:MAG: AlwI family type II restriction endonuclease, partial [Stigonema ocellatum SAG 48.90 = DSM 106950]|nr:AlwI family type II restriction endonuclease [Stigonema ocellatum SAG 48.90 = DSM 106950]